MRLLAILLLHILLVLPPAALAQDPPNCTPGREGMVACFGEKLCVCRWEPGGTLVGRPPGHRWDCGVRRPACGVEPAGPPPAALPQVSIMPLLPSRPLLPSNMLIPRTGAAADPHGTR